MFALLKGVTLNDFGVPIAHPVRCGRHYRGSVCRLLRVTVGFRPQLHAVATIVATIRPTASNVFECGSVRVGQTHRGLTSDRCGRI